MWCLVLWFVVMWPSRSFGILADCASNLFLSEVQNGTMGLDLGVGFHGFEHDWM